MSATRGLMRHRALLDPGYNRDRKYWEKWFPADFVPKAFPANFATGFTPSSL